LAFVFPHIYSQQEVIARQLHVPSHPGVLKCQNDWEYTSEIFLLIIVANVFWRKTINMQILYFTAIIDNIYQGCQ